MKYNYVIFNMRDVGCETKKVTNGYYYICTKDLEDREDVQIISYPGDYLPRFLRLVFPVHLPILFKFEKLWYPFYFRGKFKDNKPLCFLIIGGYYTPPTYLEYLKKHYDNCKIVVFHRDIIGKARIRILNHPLIDVEMTYDKGDSQKYNYPFCSEFCSKIDTTESSLYPKTDVFFAGAAKDRLDKIMDCFYRLTKMGLKCDFYLFMVPEDKKVSLEGITYIDCYMPYKECILRTVNSKCVLDINQGGASDGLTGRFIEAVLYNKKIITDNTYMKESPFYNPNDMLIIEKPKDITEDFIERLDETVDYHYNGEFSPLRMIERVEYLLNNQ